MTPPGSTGGGFSPGYRRLVLLTLMLVYALNAADRNLIPIVGQAMEADLGLSDTQLGVLAGAAFAALYALSGLPLARLAERFSRVRILAASLAVWSALSALFAFAGSFVQLAALRVGVGIGEAGCNPCAHSLISDYYPRGRRTSALSVYSCGLSLGYLFVALAGGYVTLHYGWRAACLAVALPGVALALLLRWLVAEPPRGGSEGAAAPAAAPFSWREELAQIGAVARALFLTWPAANIILGFTIASFAAYGSWAFLPAYFHRAFALDYATIGVALGLAGSVPVALGTLAGGFLTDRLGARRPRWYALASAAGLLAATPLYLLALSRADWRAAALFLALPGFFQYVSLGPSFGVVQNVVAVRQRATATALLFLCLNVLALGGGAPFTGHLIDVFAQGQFASAAASLPGASFRIACRGGVAPPGAPPALATLCADVLVRATHRGIALTVAFYVWAAVHYLLGALGLERQLRAAAAAAH
ncbi:MAG TPA: MFS transporter [Steroidobacteraceae bacterium]|nr:MFS transporter [Steroidobacteraceae bacterium]